MVGIINYGLGNVHAIANLHKSADIPHYVVNSPNELSKANKLILPGVGAFDETMNILLNSGFKYSLDEHVLVKKIPIMGICVGMQILAEESEEGETKGFGWITGKVKKINIETLAHKPHLPHLGWNDIQLSKPHPILKDVDLNKGFYFLHSYFFDCKYQEDILAQTHYGQPIPCSINKENVFGMQFHPEKSHLNGIKIFKNFADL